MIEPHEVPVPVLLNPFADLMLQVHALGDAAVGGHDELAPACLEVLKELLLRGLELPGAASEDRESDIVLIGPSLNCLAQVRADPAEDFPDPLGVHGCVRLPGERLRYKEAGLVIPVPCEFEGSAEDIDVPGAVIVLRALAVRLHPAHELFDKAGHIVSKHTVAAVRAFREAKEHAGVEIGL